MKPSSPLMSGPGSEALTRLVGGFRSRALATAVAFAIVLAVLLAVWLPESSEATAASRISQTRGARRANAVLFSAHAMPRGQLGADLRTLWNMVKYVLEPEKRMPGLSVQTGLAMRTGTGIYDATRELESPAANPRPDRKLGLPNAVSPQGSSLAGASDLS